MHSSSASFARHASNPGSHIWQLCRLRGRQSSCAFYSYSTPDADSRMKTGRRTMIWRLVLPAHQDHPPGQNRLSMPIGSGPMVPALLPYTRLPSTMAIYPNKAMLSPLIAFAVSFLRRACAASALRRVGGGGTGRATTRDDVWRVDAADAQHRGRRRVSGVSLGRPRIPIAEPASGGRYGECAPPLDDTL